MNKTEAYLINAVLRSGPEAFPGGPLLNPGTRNFTIALSICEVLEGFGIWTHPEASNMYFLCRGTPKHRIRANFFRVSDDPNHYVSNIELDTEWSVGMPEKERDSLARWARDAKEKDVIVLKNPHKGMKSITAFYIRRG